MKHWLALLFLPLILALATAQPPEPPPEVRPQLLLPPPLSVTLGLAYIDRQAVEDQPFLRLLYLPYGEASYPDFYKALRLHVNLISREAQLTYPKKIVDGLCVVDTRDYKWPIKVFEKLGDIDP